jgi:hypothetical protein
MANFLDFSEILDSESLSVDSKIVGVKADGLEEQIFSIGILFDKFEQSLNFTASNITYSPSNLSGWSGSLNPEFVNISLDQLANRLSVVEENSIEKIHKFDCSGLTTFAGAASQGSLESDSNWTIFRTIFGESGSVNSTGVASGVSWNDRVNSVYN